MQGGLRRERGDNVTGCIHRLFEAQVARAPDNVAVVCGEQSVSYQELNDRANAIAQELLRAGAGPDRIVSIVTARSIGTVATILGTLKAGAAYLPLDPDYPAERLQFMVSDSGSDLAIVPADFEGPLHDLDGKFSRIPEFSGESVENPETSVDGTNLAYAIYTSGSTGVPKAAAIEHRGVTSLMQAMQRQLELGASDRILQFASMSFDMSIWEIVGALISGAALVLGDRNSLMPGPSLRRLIRHHRVTVLLLSPSVLRILPADGLDTVRIVVAGAEKLTSDIVRRWLPGRRMFNAYGPTETTMIATFLEVTETSEDAPTIGVPVPNTKIFILDEKLRPLAPGESGELCVGGIGVGRGYIHREALTREKFVTITPDGGPPERIYRTGDRARQRDGGEFEYLGRMDLQVKIRGFRVELGEIESALERYDGVASAVVLAGQDPQGQAELWAYHLRAEGSTYEDGDLRSYLLEKLPAHMVPAIYTAVERWPLTPNRKIDRSALPPPERKVRTQTDDSGFDAAGSEEEQIGGVCRELLGVDELGVADDIFCVGFHSLLVAQLAWKLERGFGTQIEHSEIFGSPTIRQLAELIRSKREEDGGERSTGITPFEHDGDAPLSFAQERIWFLESLNPENRAYQVHSVLSLKGRLDVGALEQSLNLLVSRHEILRTSFPMNGATPVQRVHPFAPFALPVEQVSGASTEERLSEARRRIQAEVTQPLPLDRLPIIRWALYRIDDEQHLLLHREHHFLHDGWAYSVFLRELSEAYDGFAVGESPVLLPLPIQYRDYAMWQREQFERGAYKKQLDFWVRKLDNAGPLPELPSDRARPLVPTFDGQQIRLEVDEALYSKLTASCREQGVTTYMWLFALFQTFLHRYTGLADICVGTGFANRATPELETMLGMVINTVVIRGDFSGQPTFREVLQRFRQTIVEASDNQDVPFDKVVHAINPDRTAGQPALFNTFFDAYSLPYPDLSRPGLTITREDGISNGNVKFDLVALVLPRDSETKRDHAAVATATILWEFNSGLFDRSTAERMLRHFRNLMDSALADPARPVDELTMLDDEEQRRMLVEWNDTASRYPREASIASIFHARAENAPDAVAVICGDETLTYGELNRRASVLARHLREIGVEPGANVGLCIERGIDMVVGMLGIVKAGGAYVPLDPGYPPTRLAYMLEDTAAPVLLTAETLRERLPEYPGRVVYLDRNDWRTSSQAADSGTSVDAAADDLAYVMYTSGSTGEPKGVMVPHRAVLRLVLGANYVQLQPSDVVGQVSSFSFDAATFEIWGALLNGATLTIIDKDIAISARDFADELVSQRVTALFLTTALFNVLAKEVPSAFRNVHHLLFGGEAVDPASVKRVLHGAPPKRLLHVYGPTETTTFATFFEVSDVAAEASTIPIGRPISNSTAFVLDESHRPVPVGVVGELHLGGDGLALGYWNAPELTDAKFIRHPFSRDEHARLYATGDLVRYRADGSIEFVGRGDHQVKLRGFRIELEEVERALAGDESIDQAQVLLRRDAHGDKALVAYVSGAKTSIPDPETLRNGLEEVLPSYMIPSRFVVLDELPLNRNGKVDRGALATLELPREQMDASAVAPQSETEQRLASIWSELLSLDSISVHDNFFDLGGHSLLAMQVQSRVQDAFGVRVPIRRLFQAPTIGELARSVDALRGDAAGPLSAGREHGEL